jgi:hypothetical protein
VVGLKDEVLMESLLGRRCMLEVRDNVPESRGVVSRSDCTGSPVLASSGSCVKQQMVLYQ